MPRIRTIKPEFFTSPSTAKLSFPARLFFAAMWCWADDYGKGETNLNGLLGLAFPESDDMERKDVHSFCKEVQSACNVEFYVVEERPYYAIPSWDKHQKTQRKADSKIPDPDDTRAEPDPRFQADVEPTRKSEEVQSPAKEAQGLEKEREQGKGTGEQGNSEPHGSGGQAAAIDDRDANAQTLIGEWIDNCQARPPSRVIGQLSKEIKTLLDEGQDYQQVRAAVQAWNTKGTHPSVLPSVLHELRNKRPEPRSKFPSATERKDQEFAALAQRRQGLKSMGEIEQ